MLLRILSVAHSQGDWQQGADMLLQWISHRACRQALAAALSRPRWSWWQRAWSCPWGGGGQGRGWGCRPWGCPHPVASCLHITASPYRACKEDHMQHSNTLVASINSVLFFLHITLAS